MAKGKVSPELIEQFKQIKLAKMRLYGQKKNLNRKAHYDGK